MRITRVASRLGFDNRSVAVAGQNQRFGTARVGRRYARRYIGPDRPERRVFKIESTVCVVSKLTLVRGASSG